MKTERCWLHKIQSTHTTKFGITKGCNFIDPTTLIPEKSINFIMINLCFKVLSIRTSMLNKTMIWWEGDGRINRLKTVYHILKATFCDKYKYFGLINKHEYNSKQRVWKRNQQLQANKLFKNRVTKKCYQNHVQLSPSI